MIRGRIRLVACLAAPWWCAGGRALHGMAARAAQGRAARRAPGARQHGASLHACLDAAGRERVSALVRAAALAVAEAAQLAGDARAAAVAPLVRESAPCVQLLAARRGAAGSGVRSPRGSTRGDGASGDWGAAELHVAATQAVEAARAAAAAASSGTARAARGGRAIDAHIDLYQWLAPTRGGVLAIEVRGASVVALRRQVLRELNSEHAAVDVAEKDALLMAVATVEGLGVGGRAVQKWLNAAVPLRCTVAVEHLEIDNGSPERRNPPKIPLDVPNDAAREERDAADAILARFAADRRATAAAASASGAPAAAPRGAALAPGDAGSHSVVHDHGAAGAGRSGETAVAARPWQPGDWACPLCAFTQAAQRTRCRMCDTPQPALADEAAAAEGAAGARSPKGRRALLRAVHRMSHYGEWHALRSLVATHPSLLAWRDSDGVTLLMRAVSQGALAVVAALLRAGPAATRGIAEQGAWRGLDAAGVAWRVLRERPTVVGARVAAALFLHWLPPWPCTERGRPVGGAHVLVPDRGWAATRELWRLQQLLRWLPVALSPADLAAVADTHSGDADVKVSDVMPADVGNDDDGSDRELHVSWYKDHEFLVPVRPPSPRQRYAHFTRHEIRATRLRFIPAGQHPPPPPGPEHAHAKAAVLAAPTQRSGRAHSEAQPQDGSRGPDTSGTTSPAGGLGTDASPSDAEGKDDDTTVAYIYIEVDVRQLEESADAPPPVEPPTVEPGAFLMHVAKLCHRFVLEGVDGEEGAPSASRRVRHTSGSDSDGDAGKSDGTGGSSRGDLPFEWRGSSEIDWMTRTTDSDPHGGPSRADSRGGGGGWSYDDDDAT